MVLKCLQLHGFHASSPGFLGLLLHLFRGEAEQGHIEHGKVQEFQVQLRQVPGGLLRRFVVCQAEGFDLLRGQVIHPDSGDLLDPELLRGLPAGVPTHNHSVRVQHDGDSEAKLLDALRDVGDRIIIVPGVSGVRLDVCCALHHNFHVCTSVENRMGSPVKLPSCPSRAVAIAFW